MSSIEVIGWPVAFSQCSARPAADNPADRRTRLGPALPPSGPMRIADLAVYHVRIPLRRRVEHALASRAASDNLVAACRLADGTVGWGEGVPRRYVTGETVDGAFDQLRSSNLTAQLAAGCRDFGDAVAMSDQLQLTGPPDDRRGCYGNAARCAVELAVLDAFGHSFNRPLSDVTRLLPETAPLRRSAGRVRYSGAITADDPRRERRAALLTRLNRFSQCKVKVGVNGQDDTARLARFRRLLGPRIDIRVDANEAWSAEEAADRIEQLEPFGITAVEQPVPHRCAGSLAQVRERVRVPIMLDESLCSLEDARRAIARRTCDLFNIRLSKCGGFLNSLRLAAVAHANGLGFQLGCQVGETGILSAAGRHFACSVGPLRYLEGSYDRWLVRERLTRPDLSFGYGGWAPALQRPGLGIDVDRAALRRVCRRREHWKFD